MNIAEILKDCPKGTKLYSPLFGDVYFFRVFGHVIHVGVDMEESCYYIFTEQGKYYDREDAECLLFPSKDNRDWSTFKAPQKEFKKGDFVRTPYGSIGIVVSKLSKAEGNRYKFIAILIGCTIHFVTTPIKIDRYATEEEKQKLLKALDKQGYVWDAEKLELRKKEHEFRPKELVLVRNDETEEWQLSMYSHYAKGEFTGHCTFTGYMEYCLPYEGNEHLLGTTNNPD